MAKEQITIRIDPDTLREVDAICKKRRLLRTAIIQMALSKFIDEDNQPTHTKEERGEYSVK